MIAQENIEPGECRMLRWRYIVLERDNAWQLKADRWRVHLTLVYRDDVHSVHKDRFDRILPRPQGQREIAQRPVVGVKDEGLACLERWRH